MGEKKKRESESEDKEREKKRAKKEHVEEKEKVTEKVDLLQLCETQRPFAIPIAVPMAKAKDSAKIFKLIGKASTEKQIRRGVKEVVKALRKKEKGLCILAADISPLDVISHIPVLCENSDVPYIFVPSKEALGLASLTKRPTSAILIKQHDNIKKDYERVKKKMASYPPPASG